MESEQYRSRRVYHIKQTWWMLALAVILPFVFVSVVIVPSVGRSHRSSAMATTSHNAKQIHLALFDFDQDYGQFPCDATAKSEPKLRGYYGVYSNDYLGQLLASGIVESESNFYAQGGTKLDQRVDDDFSTKEKTLEAGECGFAYVKGLNTVESNYKTPLLLSPMYGDGYKFNNEIYNGRAMILRVDGALKQYKIDADHLLMTNESRGFFPRGQRHGMGRGGL